MFVLYGLISFGMILATKQRVTNAAAEAARSAVGETNDAAASRPRPRPGSTRCSPARPGSYTP